MSTLADVHIHHDFSLQEGPSEQLSRSVQFAGSEQFAASQPLADADYSLDYSIIVPVYNEEAVILTTYQRLKEVMDGLTGSYELIFVNDGSTDKSRVLIETVCETDESVKLLNFSRNFGHQAAISAGMDQARGAAVVVIDADLQDPPELIPKMVERWREGYDVVYAKRSVRQGETRFKLWTAVIFYRTLRMLTDVEIPVDTGDFRLIDRKVCDVMKMLPERSRFVRGLVAWAGFRQTAVEYVREARVAGESKYPLRRMIRLSTDAVTSFSDKPLTIPLYIGGIITLAAVLFMFVVMGDSILTGNKFSILLFLILALVLVDGLLLMFLGVFGQYIARIYNEVRQRPLYILNRNRAQKRFKS